MDHLSVHELPLLTEDFSFAFHAEKSIAIFTFDRQALFKLFSVDFYFLSMFFDHFLNQFISFVLELFDLFVPKSIELIHLLSMSFINFHLFLLMPTA